MASVNRPRQVELRGALRFGGEVWREPDASPVDAACRARRDRGSFRVTGGDVSRNTEAASYTDSAAVLTVKTAAPGKSTTQFCGAGRRAARERRAGPLTRRRCSAAGRAARAIRAASARRG